MNGCTVCVLSTREKASECLLEMLTEQTNTAIPGHLPQVGRDYYRDLMTGHVLENGVNLGITVDAWRSGSILSTPKVSMPTLSPAGGTYSSSQNIVLSCGTSGAAIRYTTDGSEPSSSSAVYSGPISVSSTTTVKAKAFLSGMADSDTVSATFTIKTDTIFADSLLGNWLVYTVVGAVATVAIVGGMLYWRKEKKAPT